MDNKRQTNIRLTPEEQRALRMLAGALGLSMTGWTSETLREKWEEKFPDMEFPDDKGNIKSKKGSKQKE